MIQKILNALYRRSSEYKRLQEEIAGYRKQWNDMGAHIKYLNSRDALCNLLAQQVAELTQAYNKLKGETDGGSK